MMRTLCAWFPVGFAMLAVFFACGETTKSASDVSNSEASGSGHDGGSGGVASSGNGGRLGDAGTESRGGQNGGGRSASDGGGGIESANGGAESNAGAGGADGNSGSGGGPTGVVEEAGSACSSPGALACAGNYQKVTLICTGGVWQANGTCPEDQFCDSTPGLDQGTCKEQAPECAGHGPEHRFCTNQTTVMVCGPDNVTLISEECTGSCHHDACDNRPNHCPVVDNSNCDEECYVNCGTECGETAEPCKGLPNSECIGLMGLPLQAGQVWNLRTPNYDDACSAGCGTTRGFVVSGSTDSTPLRVRITATAPWKAVAGNLCSTGQACIVVEPNSSLQFSIVTDDPAAPEQNIVIESVTEGETLECP